jgi:uncharacterized protein with FMN-binding domain
MFSLTCNFEKAMPVREYNKKDGTKGRSQDFLCTYKDGEYEKQAGFTVFNDALIEVVNKQAKGNQLEVSFSITGREYNGRIYPSVVAYKVISNSQDVEFGANSEANSSGQADEEDDLPF